MSGSRSFLLSGVSAPFDAPDSEIIQIARSKMKRVCNVATGLHFRLYKKSFDARRKNAILQVCTVLVTCDEGVRLREDAISRAGLRPFVEGEPVAVHGSLPLSARPLVVGMGPAGLFAALMLAEEGYAPIIIDRGDCVDDRVAATERFRTGGALDTESNIQFGAGGAGTFSDGKLVTRVNDPFCNYVLRRLMEFGAPEEIMTRAKPHVGTDILRRVVQGVLDRIRALGGEVHYRTKLLDYVRTGEGLRVTTSKGELMAGALILAIGHSARDTFEALMTHPLSLEPKPCSVGVRIEHLREDIDRALYGEQAGHSALGPAEYALSDTTGERGVYTFCMCPGGEVVTAASEEDTVVVNGMSYHARNGRNSNAAVAVSVNPGEISAARSPFSVSWSEQPSAQAVVITAPPLKPLAIFWEISRAPSPPVCSPPTVMAVCVSRICGAFCLPLSAIRWHGDLHLLTKSLAVMPPPMRC